MNVQARFVEEIAPNVNLMTTKKNSILILTQEKLSSEITYNFKEVTKIEEKIFEAHKTLKPTIMSHFQVIRIVEKGEREELKQRLESFKTIQNISTKEKEKNKKVGHEVTKLETTISDYKHLICMATKTEEMLSQKSKNIQTLRQEVEQQQNILNKRTFEIDKADKQNRKHIIKTDERKNQLISKLRKQQEKLLKLHQNAVNNIGGITPNNSHVQFLLNTIARKKNDLQCPVCLEEASLPIFGCSQFHLICAVCMSSEMLLNCPTCREEFPAGRLRINRFAEERAEDLRQLRIELKRITSQDRIFSC